MFDKILHANDGSQSAIQAFSLAVEIAQQNNSELHMVCVEEIDYMPEFIEEIREETKTAAQRFRKIIQQSRVLAEEKHIRLHTHVVAGHPVRTVVALAAELNANLLVVGARGHSRIPEWLVGSRADRIMHLARCPVLIVK
jgi:nucleotide-binding universal stress UspA family protein